MNRRPPLEDISDLPPEILNQLGRADASNPIVDIINRCGGAATVDRILIDLFRIYGEVNTRNSIHGKLYRLHQKNVIKRSYDGRKGVYSVVTAVTEKDKVEALAKVANEAWLVHTYSKLLEKIAHLSDEDQEAIKQAWRDSVDEFD